MTMKTLLSSIAAIAMLGLAPAAAQADEMSKNTVLINTFTVPADKLEETIVYWEQARDFLKEQPGYVSTKLHQSLSPDAKYLLVNVAEWTSPEAFKAANAQMQEKASLPKIEGVIPGPGLYRVIRN